MTVKMRDIAKDLGVSVITVSKVLRNHPEVGHDTRERVLARVKELDYRPNLAARSLVTGRTYLVGLIVRISSIPSSRRSPSRSPMS